jgi:ubiquinone/menaquinone biosynthesis C-methylase UbiE
MKDSTERFSDRANEYAIYRPKYPPACIDFLCNQFHLNNDSVVADIGSGTGILSQLLLEKGCAVVGVEPNADMRRMAEHQITSEKFISVNGTAESTHLRDGSVDLITVAQAFHWVDPFRAKKEFKRILRNGRATCNNVERTEKRNQFRKTI